MAFSFAETLILPPLASEAPQFVDSFLGNLQRLAWRARPSAANCPVAFEQRPGRSVTANVRRVATARCATMAVEGGTVASAGGRVPIIDLTVPIGADTYSPPSLNLPIGVDVHTKEPGHWQATSVRMGLHTGAHVDFSLHYRADGESAEQVPLDRTCGPALLVDLGDLQPGHEISAADLERADPGLTAGDIALVRTGWTDRAWGRFPDYYVGSPTCSPDAAEWLMARGCRAAGFDCFPEAAAKKSSYLPEEFVVHRIIGDGGAVLMQHLTNLDALPRGRRFSFYAAFVKFVGAEGVPARFFATVG
jgi:kynurenine formamidase